MHQQRKEDRAETATKEAEDSVTDEVPNSPTEQATVSVVVEEETPTDPPPASTSPAVTAGGSLPTVSVDTVN